MIYVIEEGTNGPLKIGTTVDIEKRIKTLQAGNSKQLNVIMTFEGGPSLENKIHKALDKHRVPGTKEWFYRVDEVFSYIQKLSTIEPKTEIQDGKEFIVLWRDTEKSPTEFCPWCGKRHAHGQGDGHRVTHCAFGEETFIRNSDGKVFNQSQGYIIRTKNK
ncbi:GIY-YIG nuclease family protein [Desulfobacterota bacterium M19]